MVLYRKPWEGKMGRITGEPIPKELAMVAAWFWVWRRKNVSNMEEMDGKKEWEKNREQTNEKTAQTDRTDRAGSNVLWGDRCGEAGGVNGGLDGPPSGLLAGRRGRDWFGYRKGPDGKPLGSGSGGPELRGYGLCGKFQIKDRHQSIISI